MTKYPSQPNDESLDQASADATWETQSSDDSFVNNMRQSLDRDLPERDETLKDRLSEQLLSPSNLVGVNDSEQAESKVALNESKLRTSPRSNWRRRTVLAATAAACLVVGSFLEVNYQRSQAEQAHADLERINEASNKEKMLLDISDSKEAQQVRDKVERMLRIQSLESTLKQAGDKFNELNESLAAESVKGETAFTVPVQPTLGFDSRNLKNLNDSISPTVQPTPTDRYKLRELLGTSKEDGYGLTGKGNTSTSSIKGMTLHNGQSSTDYYRSVGDLAGGGKFGFYEGASAPAYNSWGPKSSTNENPEYLSLGVSGAFGEAKGFGRGFRVDRYEEEASGERYNPIVENPFVRTHGPAAVSTFSIDVDTASYSNMRRFLNAGTLPPRDSVRIEELVNYFDYDYPQPKGDDPFSVNMEIAPCPWTPRHLLLRVGLQGKDIHRDERPTSNLVFLVDVSGSMNDSDKLPLLKRGLQMMVNQLTENDRVSIVTYAGKAGVVLEPTRGDQKQVINEAIERLSSGGSTHGSAGIEKAYDLAVKNRIEGGTNRVIWATDGDLNVGITDDETLTNLVAERAKEGVFLTTLGFGTGNLQDGKLEQIANKGNGIYAYIDSFKEARKVLVQQMSGSLVTIAKDVKLQIEFNPTHVEGYRLIGYENRMLATEDFDNDEVDAGEIGAGHRVTAIYELKMSIDPGIFRKPPAKLKYQVNTDFLGREAKTPDAAFTGELLTLALRYKQPQSSESKKIEFVMKDEDAHGSFDEASDDFRFAASVASFGMMLRQSEFCGNTSADWVEKIASSSLGNDNEGYRAEFIDLVRKAKSVAPRQ